MTDCAFIFEYLEEQRSGYYQCDLRSSSKSKQYSCSSNQYTVMPLKLIQDLQSSRHDYAGVYALYRERVGGWGHCVLASIYINRAVARNLSRRGRSLNVEDKLFEWPKATIGWGEAYKESLTKSLPSLETALPRHFKAKNDRSTSYNVWDITAIS